MELIKDSEVEKMLRVGRGTLKVARSKKQSDLPDYYKFGRSVRYDRAEVEEWIRQHKVIGGGR